jgi:hypothetical protein
LIDGSFPCCFAKMQWELSRDTNQAGTPPLTDYPCKWTWPLGSRINVGLLTFWFGRSWSEVLDACHDPDVGWWCFFFPLLGVIHFLLSLFPLYIYWTRQWLKQPFAWLADCDQLGGPIFIRKQNISKRSNFMDAFIVHRIGSDSQIAGSALCASHVPCPLSTVIHVTWKKKKLFLPSLHCLQIPRSAAFCLLII